MYWFILNFSNLKTQVYLDQLDQRLWKYYSLPELSGRKSPCMGLWDWQCRTKFSFSLWCWMWYPDKVRHNRCNTLHFFWQELRGYPTQQTYRTLIDLLLCWQHCYLALLPDDEGQPAISIWVGGFLIIFYYPTGNQQWKIQKVNLVVSQSINITN